MIDDENNPLSFLIGLKGEIGDGDWRMLYGSTSELLLLTKNNTSIVIHSIRLRWRSAIEASFLSYNDK